MLYEIFRIQTPRWLKGFLDGKTGMEIFALSMIPGALKFSYETISSLVKPTQEELDSYWGSSLQPLGLVDHHQSVVLTVFIDAGLLEVSSTTASTGSHYINVPVTDHTLLCGIVVNLVDCREWRAVKDV